MTLAELKEYTTLKSDEHFYEVEIKRLEELRNEKISYYSSPALDVMPGKNRGKASATESLALINVEYSKKIDAKIKKYSEELETVQAKLKAIEDFVDSVNDTEVQSMLRRYAILDESFNKIAKRFYVSRNYVANRIKGVVDNGKI